MSRELRDPEQTILPSGAGAIHYGHHPLYGRLATCHDGESIGLVRQHEPTHRLNLPGRRSSPMRGGGDFCSAATFASISLRLYFMVMRHTLKRSRGGAYLIESRHLAALDNAFSVFPPIEKGVSVAVRDGKSYVAEAFNKIGDHALAEHAIITSVSRSVYSSRDEPFSASISCSKSYFGGGSFSYEATGLSNLVDAFEAKCIGIERRIRTKASAFYDWREILISLPINVLIYYSTFKLYYQIGEPLGSQWWAYISVGVSVSAISTSVIMHLLKKMIPPFVVNLGEGSRWYRRVTAPWRFVTSKVLAMIFGAVLVAYLGWLGFGKPMPVRKADHLQLQNSRN